MASHAGFAVAITIRERLLRDALQVAHANGQFPRTLKQSLPGGPPAAELDVYLSPPDVACHGDNSLTFDLVMAGTVNITLQDGIGQQGRVKARATVRMIPAFVRDGASLALDPDPEQVTVIRWEVDFLPPAALSSLAAAYVAGGAFKARFQDAVRLALAFGVIPLPTVDISFLGSLATEVDMTAVSRVKQGAILIGLSLTHEILGIPFTITGDADQLVDFARSNEIAAVTNAAAVPTLLKNVTTTVREKVADSGATLERLSIKPGDGRFLVNGKASKTSGSATFSFSLILLLTATRQGKAFQYLDRAVSVKPRSWPALVFAPADVVVEVDGSFAGWLGAAVLSVLNPGALLIFDGMLRQASAQLDYSIRHSGGSDPIPRVRRLIPSDPGGITVRVEIADYEITPEGTYIGLRIDPEPKPGLLIGLLSIPHGLRTRELIYSVRLPASVQTDDPFLRIRWTVTDLDTALILATDDDFAAGRDTFGVVPAAVAPDAARLQIGVRAYRVLGGEITDIFNDGMNLQVGRALPPGPYVRWYYDVKNPQVEFDADADTWEYTGERVVKRHSKFHRLDQPCMMVRKRSRYTYLEQEGDHLPLPAGGIDARQLRPLLCDYCFFGGPAGERASL